MRLQPIICGIIIGGAGYAAKSFGLIEGSYLYWGALGLGILLIVFGLFMRKRY